MSGRRVLAGVVGFFVLTLGAVTLTLLWPDHALMHFWWVAQCVPILYWLLLWGLVSFCRRGEHVVD